MSELLMKLATAAGIPSDQVRSLMRDFHDVAERLGTTAEALGGLLAQGSPSADGRNAQWAVRLRIIDRTSEVIADTDPEAGPAEPGLDTVTGLVAVGRWAAEIVSTFHKGIDAPGLALEFDRRLPSLRVALARRKGAITPWAVPYIFNNFDYTARVDVIRKSEARGTTARNAVRSNEGA